MKVLVLGSTGTLGRQLCDTLRKHHTVYTTEINAIHSKPLELLLRYIDPNVVINSIGIVKNNPLITDIKKLSAVNTTFPHILSYYLDQLNIPLIHISTDCVFNGAKGNYSETDTPNPSDLYGITKLAGEPTDSPNSLTIRTSFIGKEHRPNHRGLLEWFLHAKSPVYGHKNSFFSGLTAIELSRVINMLITDYPTTHDLYHISAAPIGKLDLLLMLKKHFNLNTDIIPVDEPHIDRTLNSYKFRYHFHYNPPTWESMIKELASVY